MEQLGGIDAAMVYLESPGMPMHTGGMLVYDPASAPGGRVSAEQVRERVRSRLGRSRALRQRVARIPFDLDLPYWVDVEVDLDQHVLHDPLRAPGDWRQLCTQVAQFLERPLAMDRPLWELCLIDGLDHVEGIPAGSFAIAMKVHHAVVDGIGGLDLLAALHDTEPEPAEAPETPWDVERPSWLDLLRKPLQPSLKIGDGTFSVTVPDIARRPWRLLGVVGGIGAGYVKGKPADEEPASSTTVPMTRFNRTLEQGRSVGGIVLELSRVREIRAAVPGVTVNDVVLAVVGGGLRRYLLEAADLPEDSLVSVMPMSVRTVDEAGIGGNRLTFSTLALGTDVPDPLERLAAVHDAASKGKSVLATPAARSAVSIADAIPAGALGLASRVLAHLDLSSKMRLVNTGVTNVPGPREPIYLCGAQLSSMFGYAVVVPGVGLMHMATGIGSSLTLGFQAGVSMIPDPGHYEDCLHAAFQEILEAATCSD